MNGENESGSMTRCPEQSKLGDGSNDAFIASETDQERVEDAHFLLHEEQVQGNYKYKMMNAMRAFILSVILLPNPPLPIPEDQTQSNIICLGCLLVLVFVI